MKTSRLASFATTLIAATLVSGVALAQPGYGPPPAQGGYPPPPPSQYGPQQGGQQMTGGYMPRNGHLIYGAGFGLGGMKSDDGPIDCPSCDYNPIAGEVDLHIGGMLSDRFGLMLELQANVQTVDDNAVATTTLAQVAVMAAAQYYLSPRLYIKGGLGVSNLSYSTDDGFGEPQDHDIDHGGAAMAGIGYEVMQGRHLAVDIQGRVIQGTYDGIGDRISSGTIGLGINWY